MPIFTIFAAGTCDPTAGREFFGLPIWDKYLSHSPDAIGACVPTVESIQDYALIGLGILDILMRVAAIATIGYLMYGGYLYITSRGNPEEAKKALETLISAAIGLVITIVASGVIQFAGRVLFS